MDGDQHEKLIPCLDVEKKVWRCKPNQLILRPAVYGLVMTNDKILVIRTKYGLSLPGGELELGEHHIQGLEREVREETGSRISVGHICGFDTSYWYHEGEHYHCLSAFYRCYHISGELTTDQQSAHEREWECMPEWLCIDEALDTGFVLNADWKTAIHVALGAPH